MSSSSTHRPLTHLERTLACAGLGIALSAGLISAVPATSTALAAESSAADTSAAASAAGEAAEQPTLYIGRDGAEVEVACQAETTPADLVAALAEQTGWNLALAGDIVLDDDTQSVIVPLGEDNVVLTGDVSGVDAAYAGENREDLVYTVLNSIAMTILHNTPCATVHFSAPDGGPIEIEDGDFSFYLSNYCDWYEPNVVTTNEPLPEDVIGSYWPTPIGPNMAGWPNLSIVFAREGVQPGEGVITVTDSEDSVIDEIDVTDPERVFVSEAAEEVIGAYNLKSGTFLTVLLSEPLAPGETYGVCFDKGTFVFGDLTTSSDMTEGMWQIETYGYGLGEVSDPDGHVTVGETFTEEFLLDDNVEKVVISPSDPEICEISTTELTESGTVTYTPLEAGEAHFFITFHLTDGTAYPLTNSYFIEED